LREELPQQPKAAIPVVQLLHCQSHSIVAHVRHVQLQLRVSSLDELGHALRLGRRRLGRRRRLLLRVIVSIARRRVFIGRLWHDQAPEEVLVQAARSTGEVAGLATHRLRRVDPLVLVKVRVEDLLVDLPPVARVHVGRHEIAPLRALEHGG